MSALNAMSISEDRLKKACQGKTDKDGGMNLYEIKTIARWKGLSLAGSRHDILKRLCSQQEKPRFLLSKRRTPSPPAVRKFKIKNIIRPAAASAPVPVAASRKLKVKNIIRAAQKPQGVQRSQRSQGTQKAQKKRILPSWMITGRVTPVIKKPAIMNTVDMINSAIDRFITSEDYTILRVLLKYNSYTMVQTTLVKHGKKHYAQAVVLDVIEGKLRLNYTLDIHTPPLISREVIHRVVEKNIEEFPGYIKLSLDAPPRILQATTAIILRDYIIRVIEDSGTHKPIFFMPVDM